VKSNRRQCGTRRRTGAEPGKTNDDNAIYALFQLTAGPTALPTQEASLGAEGGPGSLFQRNTAPEAPRRGHGPPPLSHPCEFPLPRRFSECPGRAYRRERADSAFLDGHHGNDPHAGLAGPRKVRPPALTGVPSLPAEDAGSARKVYLGWHLRRLPNLRALTDAAVRIRCKGGRHGFRKESVRNPSRKMERLRRSSLGGPRHSGPDAA